MLEGIEEKSKDPDTDTGKPCFGRGPGNLKCSGLEFLGQEEGEEQAIRRIRPDIWFPAAHALAKDIPNKNKESAATSNYDL